MSSKVQDAWEALQLVYDDEDEAKEKVQQAKELLRNAKRNADDEHMTLTQFKREVTEVIQENQKIIEQCKKKKQKLEPVLEKEGFDTDKLKMVCVVNSAQTQSEELLKERGMYTTTHGVLTMNTQRCVAGWSGISAQSEDKSEDFVEVLDDNVSPHKKNACFNDKFTEVQKAKISSMRNFMNDDDKNNYKVN